MILVDNSTLQPFENYTKYTTLVYHTKFYKLLEKKVDEWIEKHDWKFLKISINEIIHLEKHKKPKKNRKKINNHDWKHAMKQRYFLLFERLFKLCANWNVESSIFKNS